MGIERKIEIMYDDASDILEDYDIDERLEGAGCPLELSHSGQVREDWSGYLKPKDEAEAIATGSIPLEIDLNGKGSDEIRDILDLSSKENRTFFIKDTSIDKNPEYDDKHIDYRSLFRNVRLFDVNWNHDPGNGTEYYIEKFVAHQCTKDSEPEKTHNTDPSRDNTVKVPGKGGETQLDNDFNLFGPEVDTKICPGGCVRIGIMPTEKDLYEPGAWPQAIDDLMDGLISEIENIDTEDKSGMVIASIYSAVVLIVSLIKRYEEDDTYFCTNIRFSFGALYRICQEIAGETPVSVRLPIHGKHVKHVSHRHAYETGGSIIGGTYYERLRSYALPFPKEGVYATWELELKSNLT